MFWLFASFRPSLVDWIITSLIDLFTHSSIFPLVIGRTARRGNLDHAYMIHCTICYIHRGMNKWMDGFMEFSSVVIGSQHSCKWLTRWDSDTTLHVILNAWMHGIIFVLYKHFQMGLDYHVIIWSEALQSQLPGGIDICIMLYIHRVSRTLYHKYQSSGTWWYNVTLTNVMGKHSLCHQYHNLFIIFI